MLPVALTLIFLGEITLRVNVLLIAGVSWNGAIDLQWVVSHWVNKNGKVFPFVWFAASQPNALAGGETAVVDGSEVSIEEEDSRMFLFDAGTQLNEIVRAVNQVGAAPGDLMAILEAMKQAGALRAELVVI